MKNKRLLTSIGSIFVVFILLCVFVISKANATTYDLFGSAWSGNVGWITFNCTAGVPAGCGSVDYKVSVDSTTGNLSGYAWSDNVGWISFNQSGTTNCGDITYSSWACIPNINMTNGHFSGFAKVLSADGNAGASDGVPGHGWEGWIDLSAVNASSLDSQGIRTVSGYAWGSGVLGWIDMSGVTVGGDIPQVYVSLTATPSSFVSSTGNVGGNTTLSWTSTNATSCSAGAPAGWTNKTNAPTSSNPNTEYKHINFTTTFTITCTNGTASATASKTVTVTYPQQNLILYIFYPPGGYNPLDTVLSHGASVNVSKAGVAGVPFIGNSGFPTYSTIMGTIRNPNGAVSGVNISVDASDPSDPNYPPEIANNPYSISAAYPCSNPSAPVADPTNFSMPANSMYCFELPVIIVPKLPQHGAYHARFTATDSAADNGVSNDFTIVVNGFGATKKIKVIER